MWRLHISWQWVPWQQDIAPTDAQGATFGEPLVNIQTELGLEDNASRMGGSRNNHNSKYLINLIFQLIYDRKLPIVFTEN